MWSWRQAYALGVGQPKSVAVLPVSFTAYGCVINDMNRLVELKVLEEESSNIRGAAVFHTFFAEKDMIHLSC